jgi:hypothetical protein
MRRLQVLGLGGDTGGIMQYKFVKSGPGSQANVQRVTTRHPLIGPGVVGRNTRLQGHEEAPRYSDDLVRFDRIRHGYTPGDDSFVIEHMQYDKEVLTIGGTLLLEWLRRTIDDIMICVLAGITLDMSPHGILRNDLFKTANLPDYLKNAKFQWEKLLFNDDITPPSSNRFATLIRDASGAADLGIGEGSDTLTANDTITLDHFMLMREALVDRDIQPIDAGANPSVPIQLGAQTYVAIVSDAVMTELKMDADFKKASYQCWPRSERHPAFAGSDMIAIDGFLIMSDRLAPTTRLAEIGARYGKDRDLHGNQILVLGAGALSVAEATPAFATEEQDYKDIQGIGMAAKIGFKKNRIKTDISSSATDNFTEQDRGVMSFFVANKKQKRYNKRIAA